MTKKWMLALSVVLGLAAAQSAQATTSLAFVLPPGAPVVGGVLQAVVGQSYSVDVVADMDTGIVGWGIDLDHDDSVIQYDSATVGPLWTPVFAPDGDGLAGLTGAPGETGVDLLLATIDFTAIATGLTEFTLSYSIGDPTEGFALQTVGQFDTVDFGSALQIVVTPEPGSAALLGSALIAIGLRRRTRRRESPPRPRPLR